MNDPIFWRLVWKEYRLMRGFWIAMAVLTIVIQLIASASVWSPNDSLPLIFAMGLALPAFYAMGCGATLFATEHETGTYQFQRALPVSAARLFFGKLPFGLVSTPLLFLLLWISAWLISGMRFPDARLHMGLWRLCGVGALELFLWGVFFSLLSRQSMRAAVLAAVAGTTTIHAITVAGVSVWRPEAYLDFRTIPYRLAVACLVAVANVWLGYRWLGDGSTAADDQGRIGRDSTKRKTAEIQRGKVATRSTILGRLIWQQWRQSKRMMLILVAMTVPLLVFMVVHGGMFFSRESGDPTRTAENLPLWIVLALATAPMAGASVFMADQRRRSFRFLTERGVSPRHVWIGRHLVWGLAVATWVALLVLPWVVFPVLSWMVHLAQARHSGAYQPMQDVVIGFAFVGGGCLAYVACAYAAGQLTSMFFKSGLLAGFFALLFSVGLLAWSFAMLWLGIPPIWSIAPIPLILLVATWLRAPHWLLERNGIKGWWSTAGWLTITTGLLVAAVLAYRVYEIPLVTPGFSPREFSQPASQEARATADMYRRAGELLVPIAKRDDTTKEETKEESIARHKAWIEENRNVIQMAIQASRRPECDGLEPPGRNRLGDAGEKLAFLLLEEARLFGAEGDLDATLERCLDALRISSHVRPRNGFSYRADNVERSVCKRLEHWAARPGQTPERIPKAIQAIERLILEPPSRTDTIKAEYRLVRRIVEGDIDLVGEKLSRSDTRTAAVRSVVAMQWMPWEKARAVRVLNAITARELRSLENVEQAVADGMPLPITGYYDYRDRWLYGDTRLARAYPTTMVLNQFHSPEWYGQARQGVDTSTRRRAACIVLALAAWKLEHGELPQKLDDLVGPYLTRLPPDPHTGEPFRYFPQGIPIAITSRYYHGDEPIDRVAAGQPFIWSTGWNISVTTSNFDRVLQRYSITVQRNSHVSPKSEYEIWQRGKCFTIP